MVSSRAIDEGIELRLERHEARLLGELLDEMEKLLEAELPREEPVTGRLFPQAYQDPDDDAKYRDLVGDELRTEKLHAVRTVRGQLGGRGGVRAKISPAEMTRWLTLLTDLRLAIGTRLEMTEEKMSVEPQPDDPEGPALSVLHWLGWVQESLLAAMSDLGTDDQEKG